MAGPFVVGLIAMLVVFATPLDQDTTLWLIGPKAVGPYELPAWLAVASGLILGLRYVDKMTRDPELDAEVRGAAVVGGTVIGAVWGAFVGVWGIVAAYVNDRENSPVVIVGIPQAE